MKKQQSAVQHDPEIMYRKNKARLIDQNRQLYSQIHRLQNKVSGVLTKNIANSFKQVVQQEKLDEKRKQQTKQQNLLIKKLKKKILLLKNSEKQQQKDDIRQASDELQFLKKQREKLIYQKQALKKKRSLKNQNLQLNKPLEQSKNELLTAYRAAQRQNFQLKTKYIKIQRQIINNHKIKQLAKTSVPKLKQNETFEIAKIQNEINHIKSQIKQIEKQWLPRIDSLNTEYFLLKQIVDQKKDELEESQKIIKNHQLRILAMKEEDKILEDKRRVSNIVISEAKRNQIKDIYEAEKEKLQYFEQFRTKNRNQLLQLSRTSKSKEKIQPGLLTSSRSKSKGKLQTSGSKMLSNTRADTKLSSPLKDFPTILVQDEKNEFDQRPPVDKKKNQNKIFESVGVGTTFYYNQDEQNL